MKLNAEEIVNECCTAEDFWEKHVHGYFEVWDHVTVCDLNVLHFSRCSLSFEGFYTYELDFNRFYLDLRILTDEVPIERLVVTAVNRSNLTAEMEFRHIAFT